jgi:hypothetical protein
MIEMGEIEIAEAVEEDLEAGLAAADSAEEVEVEVDSAGEEILGDSGENLLRCMMLFVINVGKNVKFHLDPLGISLFFAVIVSGKVKVQAEVLVQEAEIDLRHLECLQNN